MLALLIAAVWLPTVTATAQLTPQALIGDSVEDVDDAKYSGVAAAIQDFRTGKVESARQALQKVCNENKELAPADVLLTKMLLATGNRAAVSRALDQAILANPADPEAYVMYGDLLFQQSQFAPARLMFMEADKSHRAYKANERRKVALAPRIAAGLAALAEAHQDWATAEVHLKTWQSLDPKNANASRRLAVVLYRSGQTDEALIEFGNLAKLDENAGSPSANLGLLYARDGEHEQAKEMMEAALAKGTQDLQTRLAVARWAMDAGLLEMAKESAKAAVSLDADSLAAKLLVGLAARHENDLTAAVKTFTAAHLAAPSNFAASNNLALVLAAQGDEQKRQKALSLASVNARAHSDTRTVFGREAAVTYGWILYQQGKTQLAAQAIQNVPVPIPTKESAYYAAKIFGDAGRPDVVVRLLRPILQDEKHFLHRSDAEELLKEATQQILDAQSGIRVPPR